MRKAQIVFNVSMILALLLMVRAIVTNSMLLGFFALAWILIDTWAFNKYVKRNK